MKNIKKIIASAAAALMLTATLATTASAEEYYTYQNIGTSWGGNTVSTQAYSLNTNNSSTEQCSIWDDIGDFFSDVWDFITNPSPEEESAQEGVGVFLDLLDWLF